MGLVEKDERDAERKRKNVECITEPTTAGGPRRPSGKQNVKSEFQ